ncbi:MAG: NAD(P)/FAD-dependent oxidoreductase [Acidobacteria bacterium]|nr:NAD(P)/FAD-dependent oxidoreductase [Acidobacteriota bacterium]
MSAGFASSDTVAVAGAGPAGLSAALALARGGCPCVLYERGRVGGDIRCAEGVLDFAGVVPDVRPFVRTRVRRAFLTAGGERFVFDLGRRSRFAVIDRADWQRDLARQVRDAGVNLREGAPADPFDLAARHRWVVDARGRSAFPTFRGMPGAFGFGLQWTLEGDFTPWRDALDVELVSDPPGYFWIFPKGDRVAHAGFGRLVTGGPLANAWALLEDFLRRRGIDGARKLRKAGGWMPLHPCRPLVEGNVLRVGDAGAFASPLHGGGIDGAWLSGEAAAAAILDGRPEAFPAAVDRRIGLLRRVERHLLAGWEREGDAPILRAARRLQATGPLLKVSLRLFSSPGVAAAVRRALGNERGNRYYGEWTTDEHG